MAKRRRSLIVREALGLRRSLRALDRSLRRLAPLLNGSLARKAAPKGNGRARPRLAAKARAPLVLQGRYMGYMRQLKPRQKAQVRKIREVKGVSAAIARAKRLSGGYSA